jgi:PQQ-dependent catabolism-associated CXXCW motif protein
MPTPLHLHVQPLQHLLRTVPLAALLAALAAAPGASMAATASPLEQLTRHERQDLGVPPQRHLHAGPMHGPTPAALPGGQLVTTQGLLALLHGGRQRAAAPGGQPAPGGRLAPVLFDVLGHPQSLPGAIPAAWMAQPGRLDDELQHRVEAFLARHSGARKDRPLVFYCLSRDCWMSYNAALRAIQAGYSQVLWYRGGLQAWQAAGQATAGTALPDAVQAVGPQATAAHRTAVPQRSAQQPQDTRFVPVTPLSGARASGATATAPSGGDLLIGQGRFFSYALPPGWRVGEDGQFALTLAAPDGRALTVMVGNAGLPLHTSPTQYAFERLSALRPAQLQLGPPRQARPAAGFSHAVTFDVRYRLNGVAHQGQVKVSVAPAYDSMTMAMTAALSEDTQWPGYARWLPQVAEQVAASNGAAFGMRGLMQQNLRNSVAFGEAAREYRAWSSQTRAAVTAERHASLDRRHRAVREYLGGVSTHTNPFDNRRAVELPDTHRHYWIDREGHVLGTDDPGADPNQGSTGDWRRMPRRNP